jgi:hypothetical protein
MPKKSRVDLQPSAKRGSINLPVTKQLKEKWDRYQEGIRARGLIDKKFEDRLIAFLTAYVDEGLAVLATLDPPNGPNA